MSRIQTLSIACAGLLGLPLASLAQDEGRIAANQQMVVRDAKTGQMRAPTAEERASLLQVQTESDLDEAQSAQRNRLNLQLKRDASGAVGVQARDELSSYAVVSRQPDGTIVEGCLNSRSEAEKAVRTGAMPVPPQQAPAK
jgi:hypothetical protein